MSKIEKPLNMKNFTTFPVQSHELRNLYKKQQRSNWVPEEIDLSGDMRDWVKLNEKEQFFIKNILAFFAGSDGIVNWNISERFKEDAKVVSDRFKEAAYLYNFQAMIEDVHSETYSLLIDTLIPDREEQNHLFNAIETIPCVKKKADWAMKWIMDTKSSFSQRLVAFSIVEGIFFSGSFCAIYWIKKRGLLPGLTAARNAY
jgi:ribonucleoside-diphosphate reductase subunit M2